MSPIFGPGQFAHRFALVFLFFLLLICCLALPVWAQTRDTAGLRGRVLDPSGAAVPGAAVTLKNAATGFRRDTQTDAEGQFVFPALPLTGAYTLNLTKNGFSPVARSGIVLRAGEIAALNFTLGIASGQTVVVVHGTADTVQTDTPELETRLDLDKIENTPVLGRRLSALAVLDSAVRPARGTGDLYLNNTLFVVNGSGRRQTTYAIDNSTGDDSWGRQTLFTNIPFSAVQEFSILSNAASAEYGRSTGGAVNIVTKSGTNDLHADLSALWRPSSIQAAAPLATQHTGDALWQGSGAVSGPLLRDRTHFLVSAEYNRQQRDAVITSPLAPGIFTDDYRQTLLLARLDHRLSARHALMARANFDRFSDTNPSDTVGGLNLPGTARNFLRRTYSAQISEIATLSNALINEARVQFQLGSPIARFTPVEASTQFVLPGVATEGESRSSSLLNHQYQVADTVSLASGRHNLKFGADVIYSSTGGYGLEFGGGFVLGQFRLNAPPASATIANATSFQQSFGNLNYHVGETLWALFAQDNFALTPELTVNLGLRYERQTFTDGTLNFSPRAGFSYRLPLGRPTVLRAGYGIYYSELRANLAAGWNINGPAGVFTFSATPGQFGFPTSLAALPEFPAGAVLPPRDITVRPGQRAYLSQFFDVSRLRWYPDRLLNPYTQQWTIGIERELAPSWLLRVDYVGQHTIRIDRGVDLNAPGLFVRTAPGQVRTAAAADATRPIVPVPNGYRRIVGMVNEGAAYYDGLQVNLRKRLTSRFSALLSYTWSSSTATVDPDMPAAQQDPNDANLLGRPEHATSILAQRHRAVLSGWYTFPRQITLGGSASLASARPFNILTGVDNNGDGSFSDRPVIDGVVVPRNAGPGSPNYDLSTFVEKAVNAGERLKISLRGEAFNLFNRNNIVGRNATYGNAAAPAATFGQPLGGIANAEPGREFQFLLRLHF